MAKHIYDEKGDYKGKVLSEEEHDTQKAREFLQKNDPEAYNRAVNTGRNTMIWILSIFMIVVAAVFFWIVSIFM